MFSVLSSAEHKSEQQQKHIAGYVNSLQKAEDIDTAFDYRTASVVVYVSSMNVVWIGWNTAFCNHII